MGKKSTALFPLVITLFLISAAAAIALAAVYEVTKAPIEASQNKKKSDAIATVLPNFTGSVQQKSVVLPDEKEPVTVHLAFAGDTLFGAAVESYTNKAFSGSFSIMVGFDSKGSILGTEVLKMNETPGLGDKISGKKSNFSAQFVGKEPSTFNLMVKKDGGDVDAITAATISSRAFCDAVARAHRAFLTAKEDLNNE